MNNRTEKLIILKLQAGDKEAYQELYKEYSNPILQFIYYRVSDREVAKDILQEVFARFIEADNKERLTNIRAYLYRIARNLIINFYKDTGRQNIVELEKVPEVKSIIGKESIEASIDLEIVIKATDKLKPIWQDMVLMRFMEGLEYHEMADLVGRSENYIRVNLHRALKELKKIVQNDRRSNN